MLTSATLVLGKQRQEDCYKFETSLGYRGRLCANSHKMKQAVWANDSSRRHRMEIIPLEREQRRGISVGEDTRLAHVTKRFSTGTTCG